MITGKYNDASGAQFPFVLDSYLEDDRVSGVVFYSGEGDQSDFLTAPVCAVTAKVMPNFNPDDSNQFGTVCIDADSAGTGA